MCVPAHTHAWPYICRDLITACNINSFSNTETKHRPPTQMAPALDDQGQQPPRHPPPEEAPDTQDATREPPTGKAGGTRATAYTLTCIYSRAGACSGCIWVKSGLLCMGPPFHGRALYEHPWVWYLAQGYLGSALFVHLPLLPGHLSGFVCAGS